MKRILLALALVTSQAHAGIIKGSDLAEWSNARDRMKADVNNTVDVPAAARFLGYVMGVQGALDGDRFCTPVGTSVGDILDVVNRFIKIHPAMMKEDAQDFVWIALHKAYPCKK